MRNPLFKYLEIIDVKEPRSRDKKSEIHLLSTKILTTKVTAASEPGLLTAVITNSQFPAGHFCSKQILLS